MSELELRIILPSLKMILESISGSYEGDEFIIICFLRTPKGLGSELIIWVVEFRKAQLAILVRYREEEEVG